MAAWNEIVNETKAAGSVHDVIRRKYLKELQEHTKRHVILYYSGWLQKPHLQREAGISLGISDADKNGFMTVLYQLEDREKTGLDLILHTPGGDMAATESLVEYLKSMFGKNIRAFVPQLAMSGGTIIALACKCIYMGKESSIGPIDPQFQLSPFGQTAANGLLQEFKRMRDEIKKDQSAALLWQPILRQIPPGFITECENAVQWSQVMARRFLESNMFAGDKEAKAKVDTIIEHLTDKKKTIFHGRHVGLQEATEIFGDKVIKLEDDHKLQDLVLTVHHATIITLQATNAFKIIENHTGRAFMQQAKMTLVPAG